MKGANVTGGFGWVEIGGMRYSHDVVLHSDGRVTRRQVELSLPYRADYFHTPLSEAELGFLEEERPERVVVAAGWKGMMSLTPGAEEILRRYDPHALTTERALELINAASDRLVAIIHVTC